MSGESEKQNCINCGVDLDADKYATPSLSSNQLCRDCKEKEHTDALLRMHSVEQNFDFTLEEKSVRKAVGFGLLCAILGYIFAASGLTISVYGVGIEALIHGSLSGLTGFIVGLIVFKSKNSFGWAVMPIIWLGHLFFSGLFIRGNLHGGEVIIVFFGITLGFFALITVIGIVLSWIDAGR